MSKQTFALLAIIIMLAVPALAQENLGARPMGMGGAFAGLADDANAIFINPAGIYQVQSEAVLVSTRLSEGREYTLIGGVENTPLGAIGIGYVGSTDPIISAASLIGWDGEALTRYSTQTLYVSLARELNKEIKVSDNMGVLSVGANVKFSSRKLGTAKGLSQDGGSNIDLDLATVFKPNSDLSLGLSLQNFFSGDGLKDIPNLTTVEERKSAVLLGASGKIFGNSVTWVVEGTELGCEWQPVRGLAIRAGRGLDCSTAGLGINLGGFGVDYAYLDKAEPVHYWSVSITPKTESNPTVVGKAIAQNEPKTASVLPE
ncbi:MAG: hypothetical protein WC632_02615 [Candidatus Margulisiibacteriota bacterium]